MDSNPSLRHLYTRCRWSEGRILRFSALATLVVSFQIPHPSFVSFTAQNIDLPALMYLHIQYCAYEEPEEYDEPAWLPFVKIVGKELRILSLPLEISRSTSKMPNEIWQICPKLQDLLFLGQHADESPPEGHPLHTLGISRNLLVAIVFSGYSGLRWPGLRTIRVPEMNWDISLAQADPPLTRSELAPLGSLILEDSRGEPYTQFLERWEAKRLQL